MSEESDSEAVLLLEPRDGIPPVVSDAEGLAEAIEALAAGTGPVAVDAERASGYRYSGRAYLVQLRRAGAGTALIDPIGLPATWWSSPGRSATPRSCCTPPPRTCRA